MRAPLLAMALLPSLGCGVAKRSLRLVAPAAYVTEEVDLEGLAAVEVIDRDGSTRPYTTMPHRDTGLSGPPEVDSGSVVHISPEGGDLRLRVFIRRDGLLDTGFHEVQSLTGAHTRYLVDEIRWLPGPSPLEAPFDLVLDDLDNPYNGYRLANHDVVMIELSDGAHTEHLLLKYRKTGWDFGFASNILVRTPLQPSPDGASLSPAFMLGPTFGYRPKAHKGIGVPFLDEVDLVLTGGLGLSALEEAVTGGPLTDQVDRAAVAALMGTGVRVLDLFNGQLVVSASDVLSGRKLVPTLGLGLDVEQLGRLLKNGATKVLKKNELSSPERAATP